MISRILTLAFIAVSSFAYSQNLTVTLKANGKEIDTDIGIPYNTQSLNLSFSGEDSCVYRAGEWLVQLTGAGQTRNTKTFKMTNRGSIASFVRESKPGYELTIEIKSVYKKRLNSDEPPAKVQIPAFLYKIKLLDAE